MKRRFKTLKAIRATTAHEEAILAKRPTDVDLPDDPRRRAEEIDRLARTPVAKRPANRT